MPNMHCAKKRLKKDKKKGLRNKAVRTTVKNVIKRVRVAVAQKNTDAAKEHLKAAIPAIDKAASKGVIHKKKASRLISRLTKQANQIAS